MRDGADSWVRVIRAGAAAVSGFRSPGFLAAAPNVGAAEQEFARRKLLVLADGEHNRPDCADHDERLAVGALHGMIAAKSDNVQVVGGQRGELVLHCRPESIERVSETLRHMPSPF